jgi:hypothetical protein
VSLQAWLANRWLTSHRTSRDEIRALLAVADRGLHDATVHGVSVDSRHSFAYNAALQLAHAALAANGYRAVRDGHHERTINSLPFTVGLDARSVRRLDAARKRRSRAEYDAAGLISEGETAEVLALARALRRRVEEWLRAEHPDLW